MDAEQLYRLHSHWIEACELSGNMTEWEENFVESVKQQLHKKGSISPKQVEILERIYADRTD